MGTPLSLIGEAYFFKHEFGGAVYPGVSPVVGRCRLLARSIFVLAALETTFCDVPCARVSAKA
jgi:hypothetical protein